MSFDLTASITNNVGAKRGKTFHEQRHQSKNLGHPSSFRRSNATSSVAGGSSSTYHHHAMEQSEHRMYPNQSELIVLNHPGSISHRSNNASSSFTPRNNTGNTTTNRLTGTTTASSSRSIIMEPRTDSNYFAEDEQEGFLNAAKDLHHDLDGTRTPPDSNHHGKRNVTQRRRGKKDRPLRPNMPKVKNQQQPQQQHYDNDGILNDARTQQISGNIGRNNNRSHSMQAFQQHVSPAQPNPRGGGGSSMAAFKHHVTQPSQQRTSRQKSLKDNTTSDYFNNLDRNGGRSRKFGSTSSHMEPRHPGRPPSPDDEYEAFIDRKQQRQLGWQKDNKSGGSSYHFDSSEEYDNDEAGDHGREVVDLVDMDDDDDNDPKGNIKKSDNNNKNNNADSPIECSTAAEKEPSNQQQRQHQQPQPPKQQDASIEDYTIPRKKHKQDNTLVSDLSAPTTTNAKHGSGSLDMNSTSNTSNDTKQQPPIHFTKVRKNASYGRKSTPTPIVAGAAIQTRPMNTNARARNTGIPPSKFYQSSNRAPQPPKRRTNHVTSVLETAGSVAEKVKNGIQTYLSGGSHGSGTRRSQRLSNKKKLPQDDIIEIIESTDDEEKDDIIESQSAFGTPTSTKTNSKRADGDDHHHNNDNNTTNGTPSSRKMGSPLEFPLIRVAIGNKVFSHQCKLRIVMSPKPTMCLSFQNNEQNAATYHVKIPLSSRNHNKMLSTLDYFIQQDEEEETMDNDSGSVTGTATEKKRMISSSSSSTMSDEMINFLAIRVNKSSLDSLVGFSDNLTDEYFASVVNDNDDCDAPRGSRNTKLAATISLFARQFIVMELRDENDFVSQIPHLRNCSYTLQEVLDEGRLQEWNVAKQFCYYLLEDTKEQNEIEQQRRICTRSSSSSVSSKRNKKRAKEENDGNAALLVYPFVGGTDIEKAAEGLLEASQNTTIIVDDETNEDGGGEHEKKPKPKRCPQKLQEESTSGRSHFLSISREDRERLEPGEFLNDTLVDFWMRWIWRHESMDVSSVHFFTSHFYTTIRDESPEAVTSWTRSKKKTIDIFSKKLIFLPINAALHWSLCVVVNPGQIGNSETYTPPSTPKKKRKSRIIIEDDLDFNEEEDSLCSADERRLNSELPCILFFDSLKAHKKNKVANDVRKWLNIESRLRQLDEVDENPFTKKSMPVYCPRVPYQDNSWDCGVFVCKYAFALYKTCKDPILYRDVETSPPFCELITNSEEFNFTSNDIVRLRQEMATLVDNLSNVYLLLNSNNDVKKEAKRIKKEQTSIIANNNNNNNKATTTHPPTPPSAALEQAIVAEEGMKERKDAASEQQTTKVSMSQGDNQSPENQKETKPRRPEEDVTKTVVEEPVVRVKLEEEDQEATAVDVSYASRCGKVNSHENEANEDDQSSDSKKNQQEKAASISSQISCTKKERRALDEGEQSASETHSQKQEGKQKPEETPLPQAEESNDDQCKTKKKNQQVPEQEAANQKTKTGDLEPGVIVDNEEDLDLRVRQHDMFSTPPVDETIDGESKTNSEVKCRKGLDDETKEQSDAVTVVLMEEDVSKKDDNAMAEERRKESANQNQTVDSTSTHNSDVKVTNNGTITEAEESDTHCNKEWSGFEGNVEAMTPVKTETHNNHNMEQQAVKDNGKEVIVLDQSDEQDTSHLQQKMAEVASSQESQESTTSSESLFHVCAMSKASAPMTPNS